VYIEERVELRNTGIDGEEEEDRRKREEKLDSLTDIHTYIYWDRQRETWKIHTDSETHTYRRTYTQWDIQTYRHAYRQIYGRTDRQRDTHIQTYRRAVSHLLWSSSLRPSRAAAVALSQRNLWWFAVLIRLKRVRRGVEKRRVGEGEERKRVGGGVEEEGRRRGRG
jgi:hypothetical protein